MSGKNKVKIEYFLAMPNPVNHLFEVTINLGELNSGDGTIELIMPVWRSGRYLVFDFSSGVQEFEVFDEAKNKLNWMKTDKSTWQVQKSDSKNIVVKYKVYANEFNMRTRGLNPEHAFVNSTAVFMFAEKYRQNPVTLKVKPYGNWHVTTGLENAAGDKFTFTAPSYDYFIDCPLEIGNQTDFEFDVDGRPHVFSIFGEVNYDKEKLVQDISKIIKYNYEFWGDVPYKKYTFITHSTPQSGGGTEHINSTVLGARRASFETETGYTAFLGLVSHEFFHTWNVKQLKPKGLTPYDYTKENYTSELWIAEGGTSYYDGLNILRTGQLSAEDFFKDVAKWVEDDKRKPGNRIQSVAESSFDAWVKFWRRTQNNYNSESDYYLKGSYVCMMLDLEIRNSSKNKSKLDDVFRRMYYDFPLDKKGYTNADFKKYSEDAAGNNLDEFFNDYVFGTRLVDWEKYLAYAGLVLKTDDKAKISAVGVRSVNQQGKIMINEVISGSSAEEAGLLYADEIIAVNGNRMNYADMDKYLKQLSEGDTLALTLIRNEKIFEMKLNLRGIIVPSYIIEKISNPTQLQKEIYESWLNIKW